MLGKLLNLFNKSKGETKSGNAASINSNTSSKESILLPLEEALLKKHKGQITTIDFIKIFANENIYILTNKESLDSEKGINSKPFLYTVTLPDGKTNLAMFTSRDQTLTAIKDDPTMCYAVMINPIGLIKNMSKLKGVTINPYGAVSMDFGEEYLNKMRESFHQNGDGWSLEIPDKNADAIRFQTSDGKIVEVDREEYRTSILPKNYEKAWNTPGFLYQLLMSSINDGFIAESIGAAKRLYEIDNIKERGATIYGFFLKNTNEVKAAEKLYREYLTNEKSPAILANLALLLHENSEFDEFLKLSKEALLIDTELDVLLNTTISHLVKTNNIASAKTILSELCSVPESKVPRIIAKKYEIEV